MLRVPHAERGSCGVGLGTVPSTYRITAVEFLFLLVSDRRPVLRLHTLAWCVCQAPPSPPAVLR